MGLGKLSVLERVAWTQFNVDKDGAWWDRLLRLQERIHKLLGLEWKEPIRPGSGPAGPVRSGFIPTVGFDINEMLDDPEVKDLVTRLDARLKFLSGEGIILDPKDYEVKEE